MQNVYLSNEIGRQEPRTISAHCCVPALYLRYVALVYCATILLLPIRDAEGAGGLTVTSRSTHERQWLQTNDAGETIARFTEIANGLCYWDDASKAWRDSNPEIEIRQGVAGAIADKGAHTLKLAPDANTAAGVIEITLPDGARLQLQTVGLALTTTDNSDSVYISEVQQSAGEKIDATTVIYRNAFAPIKADLRVRNSLAGIESDVILRERVDPTRWGFQADNCRLEVWTKVIQSPVAAIQTEHIPGRKAGAADQDQQINFNAMSFGKGTAFKLSGQQQQAATDIRVAKEFLHFPEDNTTFLIESIPFEEAAEAIKGLPLNESRVRSNSNLLKQRMLALGRKQQRAKPLSMASQSPEPVPGKSDRKVALMEKSGISEDAGYVIDYVTVSTVTGYTFRGDTTYYASSALTMSGTTTFEGGAVIKLASGVAPTVNGPVKFLSSHYRPAVITAVNDHTVGDKIGTAAQALANEYSGTYGLKIQNSVANSISNIVVRHAATGIYLDANSTAEIRHAQIINCPTAINTAASVASAAITLRNVLINSVNSGATAIIGSGSDPINAEHVTIDIATLASVFSPSGSASLTFRNSIIYGPTPAVNYVLYSSVDSWPLGSPFAVAGAGSHYLSSGPSAAAARNAGSLTGIDPVLVAEFRQMTTEGPQLLTGPISTATTLQQTAHRDTDSLDLGYHYDALDYYFTSLAVSTTLTVASGVNLAMYGNTGISFSNLGSLISKGAPDSLNHFIHYQMVQEQPTVSGWPLLDTSSRVFFSAPGTSGATAQKISLAFCDFSPGGGGSGICAMTGTSSTFYCNDFSISHSALRNVSFGTQYYGQAASGGVLCLTNNCWERCSVTLYNAPGAAYTMRMYNNLFYKGALSVYYSSTLTTWTIYDNLFDSESLYEGGTLTAGYNGFAYPLTMFGASGNRSVMSPDYQVGTLGRFYYPASGGNLSTLLNVGSRACSAATLAQFTVRTTNLKELDDPVPNTPAQTVDIGFHYVACNSLGAPFDADGDGAPDYVEDTNGDGTFNTGDLSNWSFPNDTDSDGVPDAIDSSPTVADSPPGLPACDKCPLQ